MMYECKKKWKIEVFSFRVYMISQIQTKLNFKWQTSCIFFKWFLLLNYDYRDALLDIWGGGGDK